MILCGIEDSAQLCVHDVWGSTRTHLRTTQKASSLPASSSETQLTCWWMHPNILKQMYPCIKIFACIYTNIYMWINCLHLQICMYIHTYTNTNTSPRTFALTFFFTCANTFTYSCFFTEACSFTFTFSCTFSFSFTLHTHACMHTYIHTTGGGTSASSAHTHRFVGTWALSKSQGLECVKTLHHDHPRRKFSFRWTFSPNSSDQKKRDYFPWN